MIGPDLLARVTAEARVPEQVVPYVLAVAGSRPRMAGACVGYESEGQFLLVGYPLHDPLDMRAMAESVDQALKIPGLRRITVIGPGRPPQAPAGIEAREETYFSLPVPAPAPAPKLKSLLKRAARDLTIDQGRRFGADHAALVQHYLDNRDLLPGTRRIFQAIPRTIEGSAGARIVSARRTDGSLAAFGVGEFSALETAFFMFCFRDPAIAPPGSADLVLSGLLDEAHHRGQTRMNLGLGVSPGIRFFKRKWGAEIFLPYLEVDWEIAARKMGAMKKKKPAGYAGLREPGFWETIKEVFLGVRRPLDCIQVEVSSRCPGRCTYCPRHLRRESWRGRDMEMAAFERLWPLLRRAGRVHLQGWGEPLLNPAFADMVAFGRRAGCAVSTTTCGLIMDEPLARRIVDGGMDIVAFSLAGTDAAGNSARAGVPFERVCAAVELLQTVRRERGGVHLEIHFAYLLLASAMEAVRELPALMQRLGVHAAVVSTLDYIPQPGLEAEAIGPGDDEKLARAAAILTGTAAEARRLGLGFHYGLPAAEASGTSCRENISRSLFVSADGGISPCVYVNVPAGVDDPRRRVFGNVAELDPLAVWESAEFRRFREGLAGGCPELPCQGCPKRFMI